MRGPRTGDEFWSARAQVREDRFMEKLSKALAEPDRAEALSAQALANTCWAYATLGVRDPTAFAAVARAAPGRLARCDERDLATLAWSFAVAGVANKGLFAAVAEAACVDGVAALPPVRRAMWHHASLFPALEAPGVEMPSCLAGAADELRAAFVADAPSPSRAQRDVSAVLASIGFEHDFEHARPRRPSVFVASPSSRAAASPRWCAQVTAEGLSLDMAQPATRRAVEFDGPTHYVRGLDGKGPRLNGKSLYKRRLLAKMSWDVLYVPYFEWAKHETDDARRRYLQDGIATLM